MDESAALRLLAERLPAVGDDAAVIDGHVLTTDMLHESTDFPDGVTRYTAGWRAAGASLSDVAAMGAEAVAVVAVYAAPEFDEESLEAFIDGVCDVCTRTDAEYVGGDLDTHPEFSVTTTALGRTTRPIYRSTARAGDAVYATGTLGRSAAALALFEANEHQRANTLFQFEPRVRAGLAIAPAATAMIDSSDGLSRSLHQLASASGCGIDIREAAIPTDPSITELSRSEEERREMALFSGEDFELIFTAPREAFESVRAGVPVDVTEIGEVTDRGVSMDGNPLPNRGYEHGKTR